MNVAPRALRRVLMIAYHFPPLAGSSGIQRTLRFVQQLPRHGWQPLVLVPHPRAYERTGDDLVREVPQGTVVRRAFALDTARHLAWRGRYPGAMARPDRWISWRFDGLRQGLRLIREYAPAAIWSTYPIATAHVIGAELQRRTGLPWIADFRDPMAQPDYPTDPRVRASYLAIEAAAVAQACASLFCTPGAVADYRARYPQHAQRIALLENGFDEESFVAAESGLPERAAGSPHVLLHSGIVYPSERDPRQLLTALRLLHDQGTLTPGRFVLRLRAAVHEQHIRALAREAGVEPYLEFAPPIGYIDALREMLLVDGLLVLQAANCNQQVPAKLYEYARCGRPIVALTDKDGDTAKTLAGFGITRLAPLDSVTAIADLLRHHLGGSGADLVPDPNRAAAASRENRTAQLADLLRRLACGEHGTR